MARLFAFVVALFLALPAQAVPGGGTSSSWNQKISPHFTIYYEGNWAPSGIVLELEKIHSMLKLDMSMFSPWMTTEKVNIYIYSSQKSYVAGEFHPPQWSGGLAIYQKRCIVVYDNGDRASLRSVCAHELTHLFFESYFSENRRMPPLWLNEGLAVNMEDRSAGAHGQWTQALAVATPARLKPLKQQFSAVSMTDNGNTQEVSDWYLESFGVTKFLMQNRMQFKNFCKLLRDGAAVEQALWNVYRYHTVDDLDTAFREWLFSKESSGGMKSAFSNAQSFNAITFTPFKTGNEIILRPMAHH